MDTNQQVENILQSNRELLRAMEAVQTGEVKSASAAGTNMIRRVLREEGFLRRIIPPQTVTDNDLNTVLEHDKPVIIEEMEPKSKGAITMPFGEGTVSQTFFANKYTVVFNPYSTPEFFKDINELRTLRGDLKQVIVDNSLKDIQSTEDSDFISLCDTIVGATNGVGLSGSQQNFVIQGDITRATYPEALNKLEDAGLNNGVALMNRRTAKKFIQNFNRTELGGDLAEDLFKEGLSALSEAKLFGTRHIFTIKNTVVFRLRRRLQRATYERQLNNRMDKRNVESDAWLHAFRTRLRKLLFGTVFRAISWRHWPCLRTWIRSTAGSRQDCGTAAMA
jgi:hypothetical protein